MPGSDRVVDELLALISRDGVLERPNMIRLAAINQDYALRQSIKGCESVNIGANPATNKDNPALLDSLLRPAAPVTGVNNA